MTGTRCGCPGSPLRGTARRSPRRHGRSPRRDLHAQQYLFPVAGVPHPCIASPSLGPDAPDGRKYVRRTTCAEQSKWGHLWAPARLSGSRTKKASASSRRTGVAATCSSTSLEFRATATVRSAKGRRSPSKRRTATRARRPSTSRSCRERIVSDLVVFNAAMVHRTLSTVAAIAATLIAAAPASAKVIEIGRTDAAPACPSRPCLAVSRTTGYQVKGGGQRGAFTVPTDGQIVAWSISLGKPTGSQVAFFNKGLGGPASARLTVLRLGKKLFARTITQSPVQLLAPYFGQVVQFPIGLTLNVKKGYVIALTIPTWAPALTPLMTDHSSWRASRAKGKSDDTGTQTAQNALKQVSQYRCLYKARLTYSATLVTRPVPNPESPTAGT